jgi:predicted ester cyclase
MDHCPSKWTNVHTLARAGGDFVTDNVEVVLVRRAVAAFNAGDVEGYLDAFALDCLRWVGGLGVALTVPDIRDNITQLFAAFDDLHLDEDLLFGAGGHVCARWTLRGVHTGEYGGIAGTGREIAVDTCEVYSFTGAKVTECHVYGEAMSLFNQLSGSAHA